MKFFLWTLLPAWFAITGCNFCPTTQEMAVVTPFDLSRYLGVWHEAARMPNPFERGMECVSARYFRASDGKIMVENRGIRDGKEHRAAGVIRQVRPGTGELEVSFFRPFYGQYRVVSLKSDYSAALVVGARKDRAWILVRDPQAAVAAIGFYRSILQRYNFDCDHLEYPQLPPSPQP